MNSSFYIQNSSKYIQEGQSSANLQKATQTGLFWICRLFYLKKGFPEPELMLDNGPISAKKKKKSDYIGLYLY